MQVKKTIKKIAALAAGASMVGATIFGAAAVDLANYPAPFIQDGQFNAILVVGDTAAPVDIIGVTDIAMSLQFSMKTVVSTGGVTVSAVGESAQITKASNLLNFGEYLGDIDAKLEASDLPTLLADGTFTADDGKEYDYEQYIQFDNTTSEVLPFKDKDYDDDKTVTEGIKIAKNANVWNYTLDFTTDAESDVDSDNDLEDFEDTTITMLGKTYDIIEADNGTRITLELMRGAIKDSMEEGETRTYEIAGESYEVECVVITDTAPIKVQLKVNGELTKALEEDKTDKVSGVNIGIRSLLPNEAGDVTGDIVEFYLGAEKIVLEDTKEVEMDNEDIDKFKVYISDSTSGSKVTISKIIFEWIADDEIFITEDSEATMPGFEDVKISFEGASRPAEEEIELTPTDDFKLEMSVPIEGGTFDFLISQNATSNTVESMEFADLDGDDAFTEITLHNRTAASRYDYDDSVNKYMIISDSNAYETYVIEVNDIDTDDGCDFEDSVSGTEWENKETGETFDVGDITVTVQECNETNSNVSLSFSGDFVDNRIYTKEGLIIDLGDFEDGTTAHNTTTSTNHRSLVFYGEVDDDPSTSGPDFTLNITARRAVSESKMRVGAVSGITRIGETADDSDEYYYIEEDEVATKFIWDKGPDEYQGTIYYPGGEVETFVYVSAETTTFTETGEAGVATEVVRIEVGAAKLASAVISRYDQENLIVVGGPCVNSVAAALKGNPENCAEGYTPGKATIELFEHGDGVVAMLVSGYSAQDTTAATIVVANHDDYPEFVGTEVEVTETTSTTPSVGPVTVETGDED